MIFGLLSQSFSIRCLQLLKLQEILNRLVRISESCFCVPASACQSAEAAESLLLESDIYRSVQLGKTFDFLARVMKTGSPG